MICDITICLFHLYQNKKEKEIQNKIKKREKKNRIKPSPLFTTLTMKLLLFKVNYGQELRIGFEIRKKKKHIKVEKFVKKVKETYEKAKIVLKKS